MICNLINVIKTSLSSKENWQMIIIPFLAPVLTILGTYWITLFKIKRDQKAKKLENDQILMAEKKDVLDAIDLMVLLTNQHLESIKAMKNDVSLNLFKINSLAIFANEPLILLNQIPKSKIDLLFDRHGIAEQGKLVVYGNFLTSRQLLLQLYNRLYVWDDQYGVKYGQLTAEFSDALLNFLNYLEVVSFDKNGEKKVRTLFIEFLKEHRQYTDSDRYKVESEVSLVDRLVYKLVRKMKEDGSFFHMKEFQKHYLAIDAVMVKIRSFCHNNQIFLIRIEDAINKQIEQMRVFESMFSK